MTRWRQKRAWVGGAGCWKGDVVAVAAQPGGGFYAFPLGIGTGPKLQILNPGLLAAWELGMVPAGLVSVCGV